MKPLFSEIRAEDLELWADTPEAKQWMPTLLILLVHGSRAKIRSCRFLSHSGINHSGWDGIVESSGAGLNVPEGVSGWEISARADVGTKMNDDLRSRCTTFGSIDPSTSTLCLVSIRRLKDKSKWLADRAARIGTSPWNQVVVLDAEDIHAWLLACPGVAIWLAEFMIIGRIDGAVPLATCWGRQLCHLRVGLLPDVFLAGRANCFETIGEALKHEATSIEITTWSVTDLRDSLAAWWHTLDASDPRWRVMPVYVETLSAWTQLSQSTTPLLLLADPSLTLAPELIKATHRQGNWTLHAVESQPRPNSGGIPTTLPILDQSMLGEALFRSRVPLNEGYRIAKECGGNGTVLKRLLSGVTHNPTWARVSIAPVILLGAWDSKQEADRARVSEIFDLPYLEVEALLRPFAEANEPLLRRMEGFWRVLNKADAWHYLGRLLPESIWPKFERLVRAVLGERNPAYDLDPELWWAANVYGKEPVHSRLLHKNVGEALCLMKSRCLADGPSSTPSKITDRLVTGLLASRDWRCWIGLGEVMPLLAEASPECFLSAVEADLRDSGSICRHLFHVSQDGFAARHPHTPLIQALEVLLWFTPTVKRSILALADLAETDPGGNCYPRPHTVLASVFEPREAQSCLPLEARLAVLEMIAKACPKAGREILTALISQSYRFTSENQRPKYSKAIPSPVKLWSEYWDQIHGMVKLHIEHFGKAPEAFDKLVHRLHSLRTDSENLIWEGIESLHQQLDEEGFYPLWRRLQSRLMDHLRFQETDWSLKGDELLAFKHRVASLAPADLVLLKAHLFSHDDAWCDEISSTTTHEEKENI